MGDWGWGIGDWAQSPIPNPQSPIPNPQSPILNQHFEDEINYHKNYIIIFYLINEIKIY